jgi:hypothetical protein
MAEKQENGRLTAYEKKPSEFQCNEGDIHFPNVFAIMSYVHYSNWCMVVRKKHLERFVKS